MPSSDNCTVQMRQERYVARAVVYTTLTYHTVSYFKTVLTNYKTVLEPYQTDWVLCSKLILHKVLRCFFNIFTQKPAYMTKKGCYTVPGTSIKFI